MLVNNHGKTGGNAQAGPNLLPVLMVRQRRKLVVAQA